MTPYDQTQWGCGVAGDCMVTCIECILEIPQGTLPKPTLAQMRSLDDFQAHMDDVRASLRRMNLDLLCLVPGPGEEEQACCPRGLCAQTQWHYHDDPERKYGHARVALDGRVVHDPAPEMRGLDLGPVMDWLVLVPLDPSRPCGRFALPQ